MRILLVNQFYPPDVAATGQLLDDLARQLAAKGLEVHVLCSAGAYGGDALGEQSSPYPRAESSNVRVHRLRATGFGRARLLGRLADYLTFYALAFWTAIRLGRFDACVCLTTPPFIGLIGVLLRLARGTRLILWSMDLYPEVLSAYGFLPPSSLAYRALAWLARRIYRACDAVISLSDGMSGRLVQAGVDPARLSVVHNWGPGDAREPSPPPPGPRTVVMYSGNLGLGHQLETILEAARLLAGQPHVCFVLVGKGKMRLSLERQATAEGLLNVEFREPVPLAELAASLASAHIHLVSQREGTQGLIVPSKLYGCLAAGRPVILAAPADCDAAAILRLAEAGCVIPPDDAKALADGISHLTGDGGRRERLGLNGWQYYQEHLGRERSIAKLDQIITGGRPRHAGQETGAPVAS